MAAGSFAQSYLALFSECFPETSGTSLQTPEHYQWKFGPAGKFRSCCEYATWDTGELIGYYAALPFTFTLGGSTAVCGLVCDVMTHTRARGKGVFTALGRYATSAMGEDGIDFVIGYPIRPEVIPGHLKVGWEVAFPLPVYALVLDPGPVLAQRGLNWLAGPARVVLDAWQKTAMMLGKRDLNISEDDPGTFFSYPEFGSFYQLWASEQTNYMQREPAFWRWRLAAPAAQFTLLVARSGSQVVGIAVARRTTVQGLAVLAVADLMWLNAHARGITAMHAALMREGRRQSVSAVAIMCTEGTAKRLRLPRNGYLRTPVEFKLILKWLASRPRPANFLEMSAWHVTWLDTDTV